MIRGRPELSTFPWTRRIAATNAAWYGVGEEPADQGTEPSDLAYLIDRVRVGEKRPQLYGTQYHAPDGALVPRPIEDREHLDERRAQVGLEPHADYDRSMHELHG